MYKSTIQYTMFALLGLGLSACELPEGQDIRDRSDSVKAPGQVQAEGDEDEGEAEKSAGKDKAKKDKSKKDQSKKGKSKNDKSKKDHLDEDESNEDKANKGKGKWACLHHHAYWKTHSAYSKSKQKMAWPDSEDNDLCGKTWHEVLWTPPNEDVGYYKLAYQWIAAQLNLALGAAPSDEVQKAIDAAGAVVSDCTNLGKVDAEATRGIWKTVHAFNHGQSDHSCGDDEPDEPEEPQKPEDPKKPGEPEQPDEPKKPEDPGTPADDSTPSDEIIPN